MMALPTIMKILALDPSMVVVIFIALLFERYGESMQHAFGCVGKWLFHICVLVNKFVTLMVTRS